jgi:hypothetical protein
MMVNLILLLNLVKVLICELRLQHKDLHNQVQEGKNKLEISLPKSHYPTKKKLISLTEQEGEGKGLIGSRKYHEEVEVKKNQTASDANGLGG